MAEIDHLSVPVPDFSHALRCRSDGHEGIAGIDPCYELFQVGHSGGKKLLIFTAAEHSHHGSHRRIMKDPPVGDLLPVEGSIGLICGTSDCIVVRGKGLDHRAAALLPAACPSDRLRDQLIRPLCRPVIVRIERQVCHQDPDQRDIREVMSLHDHLCSDEHVRCSRTEIREDLRMSFLPSGRVIIHAERPDARKFSVDHLLDLLCPESQSPEMRRSALRTRIHIRHLIAAVMTDEPAVLMSCERDIAVRTLYDMTARPAAHEPGISASVEKEHALLPAVHAFPDPVPKDLRKDRPAAGHCFLSHIDDDSLREDRLPVPLSQRYARILPGLDPVGRRQRGGRRAHEDVRTFDPGPLHCGLPRMVAGHKLRAVGLLMLLIDHDQTEISERGKKGGPGTDHDRQIPAPRRFHLIIFFSLGKP